LFSLYAQNIFSWFTTKFGEKFPGMPPVVTGLPRIYISDMQLRCEVWERCGARLKCDPRE